jgi:hypothetical protein
MSEIDRVFGRLGPKKPGPNERRGMVNVPRKGSTAGSRTVEVVHLRSRGAQPDRDEPSRSTPRVHAATWEEGFPARTAPPAPEAPAPRVAPASQPVGHVMPVRTLLAPAPEPPPEPAPAAPPARRGRPPGRPRPDAAEHPARRVADPFDATDDGANCLRCGYVVEPARERRGLLTCAACG